MAKELKQIICEDLRKQFRDVDGCVLIDFRGLNSEQTQDLRDSLRAEGVRMNVVRNRLARRIFDELGAPPEFREFISGPIAVLFGGDGAFTASKGISKWRKKNADLAAIRGGMFQGQVLSPAEVQSLAEIPEPDVLRAQILSMFLSPMSHLSSCAQALLSHFAGCAKARHESLSAGTDGPIETDGPVEAVADGAGEETAS